MKRISILLFFAVVVAAAVFALVSCDEESAEEVPVGVVVPLKGELESTGLNMRNGMELALEEINGSSLLDGKKIRFIVEDSESTVEGARRAYRKLIEQDGVVAVLGPFTATSTGEVIPISHENKVVSFSPTSAANGLSAESEFAFRASLTVGRLVPEGVSITRERLRYSKVATITNDRDAFSQSNLEQLKRAFDDEGVTVVSEQSYTRSQNELFPDLTDQLTEIKDANPEAIFISALTSGRMEIPVQARRLGIEAPFIMTLLTIDDVNKANAASAARCSRGRDYYFDHNGDAVYEPILGIVRNGIFEVFGQ